MFSLLVLLEGRESGVILWFKDRDRAFAASKRLLEKGETADDYGHHLGVSAKVAACMVSEIDRDHECQTEMALRQARAQASANAKASADPVLKFTNANRPPFGIAG